MDSWRELPVRYICKPKGAASTRRFETLCLFHFFDIFEGGSLHGSGEVDLEAAADFTSRWGPLRTQKADTPEEFKDLHWELKLHIELYTARSIPYVRDRTHDLTWGPEADKAHQLILESRKQPYRVPKFIIVMDEHEGKLRPHLEPEDLAAALTFTALTRGRDDYTECYFITHIQKKAKPKPRYEGKCKRWVLKTGRPGRSTRYWCSQSCKDAVKYDEKLMKKGAKK